MAFDVNNDSQIAGDAVRLAEILIGKASLVATRTERRHLKRFARLLDDDAGKMFVNSLTDEVLRVREPWRAALRFKDLVNQTDLRFATMTDRALLNASSRLATRFPRLVMSLVRARINRESSYVVVSAEDPDLARHIQQRRAVGMHPNINILGEAVLGEEEADRRLNRVLEMLRRPDINYLSVKLSSISSRMKVLAFDKTVAEVAERMKLIYREAARHDPPKF